MPETMLRQLYRNLRLLSYRTLFGQIKEKDGSLSATEAFAVDVIGLMGEPTIKAFAECVGISQPNATYKINNLIAKGYVERLPQTGDRREVRVRACNKYHLYFGSGEALLAEAERAFGAAISPEDMKTVENSLSVLNDILVKYTMGKTTGNAVESEEKAL